MRDVSTRIEAIWRDPVKSTSAISRGVGRYVWLKARPPSPVDCTVRRTRREVKIDENSHWRILTCTGPFPSLQRYFKRIQSYWVICMIEFHWFVSYLALNRESEAKTYIGIISKIIRDSL